MDRIRIKPAVLRGMRIENKIDPPDSIRKTLTTTEFYAQYDEPLNLNLSILNVPAVASMLPIAWVTGTDIQVKVLDRAFFESMIRLQEKYKDFYPEGKFATEIFVEELVENKTGIKDSVAMTLSGGVDSTYTLACNIDLKPRLIMLFRFTHREWRRDYFDRISGFYAEQAKKQGLSFNIIDSNIRDIIDWSVSARVSNIIGATLWGGVQQIVIQTGVTAPLSIGRFNQLIIGASNGGIPYKKRHFISSRPQIDNNIAWADLSVENHGHITRQKKIKTLIEYMDRTGWKLNTCMSPSGYGHRHVLRCEKTQEGLNCDRCEKCLRTIVGILVEGRDPSKYGYNGLVNEETFHYLREVIGRRRFHPKFLETHWLPIQDGIPDEIEEDFNGSRAFLKWLKQEKIREWLEEKKK